MPGVRRYELLEKVGASGMAEIFLADAHAPDGSTRRVLVKKIHPHHSEDAEYQRMFMDEARIAGSLDHPNIVRVIDLGRMDDQLFIALERVEGKDLQLVLRAARVADRKLPVDCAVWIAHQVLRALDYAHTRRAPSGREIHIVHRDITPANVVIAQDGSVKVTDFGVAKRAVRAGQTVAGVIRGNVRYMSPEQVRSQEVDHRSDLYAAGMILHALLSGRHPFENDTVVKAIERCVDGDVPTPSSLNPAVPPMLDAIVMRAVSKDRARRHESAAAFLEQLEAIAAPRNALDSGRVALAALLRELDTPPETRSPRARSIVARLGPLIAEAAKEGGEVVFRTTGRMLNPDLLPPEAEAAAAKKSKPPFTLAGHTEAVTALAAFPDGRRLVSGSEDRTLRVWSTARAKEEMSLRGHEEAVTACAVSADGASILSAARDATIRHWDASGAGLLRTLTGHDGPVLAVTFGPDGRHALSGGADRTVRVWDLETNACVKVLDAHRDAVTAVAFTPDGKHAISGSQDGTVRIWELRTGRVRHALEPASESDTVRAMAVSADGSFLAAGGEDSVIRLWDVQTGAEVSTFSGHREPITGLGISRNMKLIASSSADGTARLWAVSPSVLIRTFETSGPLAALALSPDLRWLAAAGERRITVFPL